MSRWSDKYVIGLTGNIATGKSVVRRMLEHLGAFGIDADAISHLVIKRGAPGYLPVVEYFGRYILNSDKEINRARLGKIVFNDPEALQYLENIVHPLVSRTIDLIIKRSKNTVIVIEAIKLLEGNLAADCNSIWVTYASPEIQLERLMKKRKMSEEDAWERIQAQSTQDEKIRLADVVIRNTDSIEETWQEVVSTWRGTIPPAIYREAETAVVAKAKPVDLRVEIANPSHASEIATFFDKNGVADGKNHNKDSVMEAFGEKAFLLLRLGNKLVGVVGWQVENLITRTTDLILSPECIKEQAYPLLIKKIEGESQNLFCEVSMVFVTKEDSEGRQIWQKLGYEPNTIENLKVPVWIEAAKESMPKDSELFFKKLREDRILRPI